jgi:hypothetical protein
MITLINGEQKYRLLSKDDNCEICDAPRSKMVFSWNTMHGEATSECCGATYQVKNFYIKDPNEVQKQMLDLLRGDHIMGCVKLEWIEPIREAMKELGADKINDKVVELAHSKLPADE